MDLEMARRGGDKRSRRFHAANAAGKAISGALVRDALKKGNARTTRVFQPGKTV
jgi:aspartate oxidase